MAESKLLSSVSEASPVTIFITLLIMLLLVGVVELLYDKKRHLYHIPGPTPLPFFGNALMFTIPVEEFMKKIASLVEKYGPVLRIHLGTRSNALVCTPEAFEKILSSNKHITKGKDYRSLWPWLGTGLLTSTGEKWHSRRKMLTPAFHFRILESFLKVMNHQSSILCEEILPPLAGEKEFDVFPIVTHCALDIICETAMGKSINAQQVSDTDYVRAIYEASDLVFQRQRSPWLWNDWLFAISPPGFRMRKVLNILHGFTNKVIAERKEEWMMLQGNTKEEDEGVGQKKRHAFLDLLLDASEGGKVMSDMDIREEVDTFMFEGHDTTATNMSFSLWLLATHPEIQARCHKELDTIFSGDQDREATSQDLAEMKYLESCLKESLRLYQSVPIIGRQLGEEVEIEGHVIPRGTNMILLFFLLHRDPKTFPDPNRFDPERFSLENQQARHPYSYVPFSAGPRNCIGQKFATMEEKVVVSSVLRKYTLRSTMTVDEIPLCAEVILRPKNGLRISLQKR